MTIPNKTLKDYELNRDTKIEREAIGRRSPCLSEILEQKRKKTVRKHAICSDNLPRSRE